MASAIALVGCAHRTSTIASSANAHAHVDASEREATSFGESIAPDTVAPTWTASVADLFGGAEMLRQDPQPPPRHYHLIPACGLCAYRLRRH